MAAELPDFDDMSSALLPLGAVNSPSEVHGMLCGRLCGGSSPTEDAWIDAAWELLDVVQRDVAIEELFRDMLAVTQAQLDSGDYDLQPLLPDDETELAVRTQALSQWCHGFLSGFGSAGIDPKTSFSSDQADALRDLAAIVQVVVDDEDEEESPDEQEGNFLELVEYVRVLAMSFYQDFTDAKPKPEETVH